MPHIAANDTRVVTAGFIAGLTRPRALTIYFPWMVPLDKRPHLSDRERMRLFRLHKRTCHICGFPIDALTQQWDIEHVIQRFMLGAAADTDDNMKPAHRSCHKGKSKGDAGDRAKAIRRETKQAGGHRSKNPLPGGRNSRWKRKLDGTVVERKR